MTNLNKNPFILLSQICVILVFVAFFMCAIPMAFAVQQCQTTNWEYTVVKQTSTASCSQCANGGSSCPDSGCLQFSQGCSVNIVNQENEPLSLTIQLQKRDLNIQQTQIIRTDDVLIPASGQKLVAWEYSFLSTDAVNCVYAVTNAPQKQVCTDTPTTQCTSHATQHCSSGSVYWYDSCENRQELAQACSNSCDNGQCLVPTPSSHYAKHCSDGSVYWYDSADNRQDLAQACTNGCNNGQCLTTTASIVPSPSVSSIKMGASVNQHTIKGITYSLKLTGASTVNPVVGVAVWEGTGLRSDSTKSDYTSHYLQAGESYPFVALPLTLTLQSYDLSTQTATYILVAGGGTSPSIANCPDSCSNHDQRWCDGNNIYKCYYDSKAGCYKKGLQDTCPSYQTCSAGLCKDHPCESKCSFNGRSCGPGGQVYECKNTDGCNALVQIEYCDTSTHTCSEGKCIEKNITYTTRCYSGDVYSVNIQDQLQGVRQQCDKATEKCLNGACIPNNNCRSHSNSTCYENRPTWYDSCGNREEAIETCDYSKEKCEKGKCVPKTNNECSTGQIKCFDDTQYQECVYMDTYKSYRWHPTAKSCASNQICSNDKCQTYSSKYPIILVHGFQLAITQEGNSEGFDSFQKELEKDEIAHNKGIIYSKLNMTLCDPGSWSKPISVRFEYYNRGDGDKPIEYYAKELNDAINVILQCTGSDKVTIVAHSMGGLVARNYINMYSSDKVDKLITLGTPHYGATISYTSLGGLGCDTINKFNKSVDACIQIQQLSAGSDFLTELNSKNCGYRGKITSIGSSVPTLGPDITFLNNPGEKDKCNAGKFAPIVNSFFSFFNFLGLKTQSYPETDTVVPLISTKLYGAKFVNVDGCNHFQLTDVTSCSKAYETVKNEISS
jgi:pimeloyl-ACP methyl ester carboxylesterase